MAVNSAGFQIVGDGGIPQTKTATAVATISAGMFVAAGSIAATASSGANSFSYNEIQAIEASGTNLPIGIAVADAGSTDALAYITKGDVIIRAAGAIVAGNRVRYDSNHAVTQLGSVADTTTAMQRVVGKAINNGTSGGYVVVSLQL